MKQFSKDLGNVCLAPKGKWSKEQKYERLALVYNACNNLSYVAKINVPIGVEIDNREYWQPMNATGYSDNNFINLTAENENGTITAYESLEEAIATIVPVNRRAGATLSFYNLNADRLDRQAEFELWQFNSTDLANWENKDYWNNIYYNWNVFAGWYVGADALKNHVKIPNVGQYAYVGSNLNDAILYQCRTNGTWTNTGIKVRNYISVVVSGNITIGENGNWFSNGEDTGIPATPAVDEQLDNIINKHESLSRTVQGIAATGGASTATNVTYNNDSSGLNAENAQDAIDELQGSKINKTSILQESGEAKDKVMSQKAVSDKFTHLFNRWSYMGIATPSTVPPTSEEGRLFYFALRAGEYINFPTTGENTHIVTGEGLYMFTKEANSDYWKADALIDIVNELGSAENKVISQKLLNEINNTLTKGKYIGLDGTIKSLSGWNATLFYISIDNVKSFSVKANRKALCIAYYDSNLKFISGIEGTGQGLETYTEEELQNKPSNAKYVRFSYTVKPFKLELYTGNPNINDGLIEFIDSVASAKIVEVNAWNGKSCAFLGDSITDPIHVGTSKNYWQYLGEILGIKYKSYGQNGAQSTSIFSQAQKAYSDNPNYDAIFIFFGTNDFNANVPIGNWYEEENKETNKNGQVITLKHRIKREDTTTFKNRLNKGLSYIKRNFPNSQVIMMTPIHRAYAQFGSSNQQPDESFANTQGLYISDYVEAVKECANVWATELIDLNSISGLYPLFAEYSSYFHDSSIDMLHPNANGHFRMAQAIAAKMNSISCLQKPI